VSHHLARRAGAGGLAPPGGAARAVAGAQPAQRRGHRRPARGAVPPPSDPPRPELHESRRGSPPAAGPLPGPGGNRPAPPGGLRVRGEPPGTRGVARAVRPSFEPRVNGTPSAPATGLVGGHRFSTCAGRAGCKPAPTTGPAGGGGVNGARRLLRWLLG